MPRIPLSYNNNGIRNNNERNSGISIEISRTSLKYVRTRHFQRCPNIFQARDPFALNKICHTDFVPFRILKFHWKLNENHWSYNKTAAETVCSLLSLLNVTTHYITSHWINMQVWEQSQLLSHIAIMCYVSYIWM